MTTDRTTDSRDARQVQAMFERIAARYDRANTVLSAGRDVAWRRQAAAAAAPPPGGDVLDVACGTGLLTRELRRLSGPRGRAVGLDFSSAMLAVARAGDASIEWVEGDATSLPFDDASFDVASMAFGLRNLADQRRGLAEMWRVVRPGGTVVVLEFLRPPQGLVGSLYSLYLRRLVPRVGGLVAGDPAAYRYLSETIDAYHAGPELLGLARRSGWRGAELRRLNLGTVGVMRAVVG